jgi:hypothetical protein
VVEAGLDVSLLPGGPNAPVEPPVVSGTALVGISAADYTAAAVEQGAPFKILGVAMQKNPFVIASLPANPVNEPPIWWASASAWRWPTRRCCRRSAR